MSRGPHLAAFIAGRFLAVVLLCVLAAAMPARAQEAAALKARHAELQERLANNWFQRPLHVVSIEQSGTLQGDVYARLDQPFAVVAPALQGLDHWCEILFLHQNVKQCRASAPNTGDILRLNIGRKFDQPLADAYLFEFTYRLAAARPDYLEVKLEAEEGPLGTRRYRIVLLAVELADGRSFLHLSYRYEQGFAARVATQLYLATLGRGKVGFSVVGTHADGAPIYIGSTRGVVERNSMLCYLAIEAYLGALSAPPAERFEKRLSDWHAGVERYPLQLHEIERDAYLVLKRSEFRRQQSLAMTAAVK